MSQRVKFSKNFDHTIRFGVDVAYKKGHVGLIPDSHFEAAKAAGAIEEGSQPVPSDPSVPASPKKEAAK